MGTGVDSFSYDTDDEQVLKVIDQIAKREKRSKSFVVMEALKEYAKAHGKANPQYTLDNPSIALPTIWRPVDLDLLSKLGKADRKEMEKRMEEWYKALTDSDKRRGWD